MRPSRFALLALIVAMAVLPWRAAAETAWPRVAPRDFTFAAMMPVAPTVEALRNPSFFGDTNSTTYFSNIGDNRFTVSVTEIPRAAKLLAPLKVLFTAAKSRLLEEVHAAEEESFTPTERDGVEGRRMLFESSPPDEGPRRGRAEIYFVQGKLLVAVGSHPRGASDHLLTRFFSGLRVDLRDCREDPDGAADLCRVDLALDD